MSLLIFENSPPPRPALCLSVGLPLYLSSSPSTFLFPSTSLSVYLSLAIFFRRSKFYLLLTHFISAWAASFLCIVVILLLLLCYKVMRLPSACHPMCSAIKQNAAHQQQQIQRHRYWALLALERFADSFFSSWFHTYTLGESRVQKKTHTYRTETQKKTYTTKI